MADKPLLSNDPMYLLLREENVEQFNKKRLEGIKCDLRGVDLRGLDLRSLNADGLDLSGAYFRGTDLRGVDFRNCLLEGASMMSANISGCYFPKEIRIEEILASVSHGTRMRYDS